MVDGKWQKLQREQKIKNNNKHIKPETTTKKLLNRNTFELNVHQDMFARTCVVNVCLYAAN